MAIAWLLKNTNIKCVALHNQHPKAWQCCRQTVCNYAYWHQLERPGQISPNTFYRKLHPTSWAINTRGLQLTSCAARWAQEEINRFRSEVWPTQATSEHVRPHKEHSKSSDPPHTHTNTTHTHTNKHKETDRPTDREQLWCCPQILLESSYWWVWKSQLWCECVGLHISFILGSKMKCPILVSFIQYIKCKLSVYFNVSNNFCENKRKRKEK